ncbi:hypothetical protein SLEP1_g9214 [Rubroshorea leprosula]|uniref:Mechanosensitive ion channel protein n=1 Tax=Rubroshorea leprosula TaxID=152421 RepID=A0AAV5I482_9ROSI|nr:hypothetical protein SLEP1_g9214 [Rubroshorea leprosula]
MEKASSDQVVINMDQNGAGDPKPQNPIRAKTLDRLSFSKPKARFVEYNFPFSAQKPIFESNDIESPFDDDDDGDSSSADDDDEVNEELEKDRGRMGQSKNRKRKKKFKWRLLTEWVAFFIIMTFLICYLTIESRKEKLIWGLEIWKWCLMVLVTFCGRLVSGWLIGLAVFFIERNFMLREKVLYFVYGLRKSIQNCIWLGLVLLAWTFMFNGKVKRENKILKKVFKTLVAILLAATIWLMKIVFVKILASSFHVATFFDRMKESVFHHYILDTLSGPPMDEQIIKNHNHLSESKTLPANWKDARSIYKSKKYGSRKIDMEKLRQLSMETRASAWSMKRLVSYIRSSGLSTISRTVDDFGKAESEINSEWEARNMARRIFKNVAKPGAKYIEEEDLMRFLKRAEIHTIFPLFEGALETGRISKSSFRNWVVRAYFERKFLAHSLNDTKTAVQQLHKLASSVVIVIIIVVSLLVMEVATPKVILVVLTNLILVGFMFQNTCKMVFESIVFIFIMHPFDIGDRCVIDDVQMIVEEMNILTTVFLRYDMEKIYYPNSVLLTKPISNFYRSPEMHDCIDFTINLSTPMDTIIALKKAIQIYIESRPKYWNPKHLVFVKEIGRMNKLKMALSVQHTINHQNYGERCSRITELILELKKIFENLGIEYHLLPQEVHLTQVNFDNWSMPQL